ncbi:hypothetical protein C9975_05935 [Thalassospira xiamenensis]|nr:hypothetical protein C9975_05935 [Thalassospira xiamenensis]
MATFFIIRIKEDKGKILGVVLVFLSLSILVASYSERLDETRQAKVLDIGSDQSWASRQALMDDALERIAGAPFTGRFGGHFENGGAGSYVHNILSAWDGYGLIAFVLVIFIVAVPLWESLGVVYKRRELTPFQAFYFFVSLSTFVLLLGAKTIYWPIPGLLWGLCLNKAFRREGRVVGGNLMTIN